MEHQLPHYELDLRADYGPVCLIQDDEQTVPSSYAHVVCSQFAQLGARGVSVFFGSGDGGVSGVQAPGSCKSNVNNQTAFIPLFPSSCPYVTSVGGRSGMVFGENDADEI